MRTAVNLQHERVGSTGIEVHGLEHPALDHPAIGRGERFALRLSHISIAQPRVQIGYTCLGALREHVQLARTRRIRCPRYHDPKSHIEGVDAALAIDLSPFLSFVAAPVTRT